MNSCGCGIHSRSGAAIAGTLAILLASVPLGAAEGSTTGASPAGGPVTVKPTAKVLPKITVEVKAIALSTIPEPRSLAPYVECLSCNLYEVTKVVSSESTWPTDKGHVLAVGQKIQVMQWGVQKAAKTSLADAKVGDARTMVIQDPENSPQFDEISRTCSIDWDVDMATFYEPVLAVTAVKPAVAAPLAAGTP